MINRDHITNVIIACAVYLGVGTHAMAHGPMPDYSGLELFLARAGVALYAVLLLIVSLIIARVRRLPLYKVALPALVATVIAYFTAYAFIWLLPDNSNADILLVPLVASIVITGLVRGGLSK